MTECFNLINKRRNFIRKVTNHLCSKIPWLWRTWIKYSTSFYAHNWKTALFKRGEQMRIRCFPDVNHHWVRTTRVAPNWLEEERATIISMVHTGCSSESVRTIETQCRSTRKSLHSVYKIYNSRPMEKQASLPDSDLSRWINWQQIITCKEISALFILRGLSHGQG